MDVYLTNLEQGMPALEVARIRLDQALRTAKAKRYKAVKIVHGYGSTGKGGAIRRDVLMILAGLKRSGKIKTFVVGEEFSPFYSDARRIVEGCPSLVRDRDYSAANHGITIVLL